MQLGGSGFQMLGQRPDCGLLGTPLQRAGQPTMVVAIATRPTLGPTQFDAALLGEHQREPQLVAQSRVPTHEVVVARSRHERRVKRLVGRGSGDCVTPLVRDLDLAHERLQIGRPLFRGHVLEGADAGELQHLARLKQIIDLLVGDLSDDRATVHLVADEVLTFQDADRLAYRIA